MTEMSFDKDPSKMAPFVHQSIRSSSEPFKIKYGEHVSLSSDT